MSHHLVYLTSNQAFPFGGAEDEYVLFNAGNYSTSKLSVFCPIPFDCTLKEFAFVVRGKFPHKISYYKNSNVQAWLMKNGSSMEETHVRVNSTPVLQVFTWQRRIQPEMEFKANDSIGMRVKFHRTQYHTKSLYVSGLAIFEK